MPSGHNVSGARDPPYKLSAPGLGGANRHIVLYQDPKLLYAIEGVSAYHISNGKEEPLTRGGPQTLSLLMVPTSSAFADPAHVDSLGGNPEEDFYLHLHLPPELDLPLPATTQIYHQPPRSYLIPRWDLGPDSGAFTRIEFPSVGSRKGLQEDVDTFETILAQCTAFLERYPAPRTGTKEKQGSGYEKGAKGTKAGSSEKDKAAAAEALPAYNPADFKPGEAYVRGSHSSHPGGQIVLIDEEDGSVIGELADGFNVVEDSALKPGSKGMVRPENTRQCAGALTNGICQIRLRLPSPPRGGKISPSPQRRPSMWTWICTQHT